MGYLQLILKAFFVNTLLFIINKLDSLQELFLSQEEREYRRKRVTVLVCKYSIKLSHSLNYFILHFDRQKKLIQKIHQVHTELVNFPIRYESLILSHIYSMNLKSKCIYSI